VRKPALNQLHGSFQARLRCDQQMHVFRHKNKGVQSKCSLAFVAI
jgi:hypothetical protein